MPILLELLKDDSSEVRLNVASNMIKIAKQTGPDLLSPSSLTILTNLTKDAQWRVRMAAIELIGDLSLEFGLEIYKSKLESIFMSYLDNSAASVREMAIVKVGHLAEQFKSDWVLNSFVPKVIDSFNKDQ